MIVIGVNPRRPFDDDYQSFIQLLNMQLATSLASTTLLETEIRRGLTEAEAAALERARLSAELATQKNRMQRIAEVRAIYPVQISEYVATLSHYIYLISVSPFSNPNSKF